METRDPVMIPLFQRDELPARLARQHDAGALSEAEGGEIVEQALVSKAHANFRRADVRRLHHHLLDREHAITLVVVERLAFVVPDAAFAINRLAELGQTLVQRRADGDDLESRTRLVAVHRHAILE